MHPQSNPTKSTPLQDAISPSAPDSAGPNPASSGMAVHMKLRAARKARLLTLPMLAVGLIVFAGVNAASSGAFTLLTPQAGTGALTIVAMALGLVGLATLCTFQGALANALGWALSGFGFAGVLSTLDRPIVASPYAIAVAIAALTAVTLAVLAARWDTHYFWDPNRPRRKRPTQSQTKPQQPDTHPTPAV